MRISDWSSDVCSSDLVTPIALAMPGRSAVAIVAVRISATVDRHGCHVNFDSVIRFATSRRGYRIQCRPNCCGDGNVGTVSRSEEHTSELQSLMRSSYAVFCLKKKTTQVLIRRPQIQRTHRT